VFKSQSRRCRVTILGKLFTPIVPLFTEQRNSELLGDTSRHATSLTRYVPVVVGNVGDNSASRYRLHAPETQQLPCVPMADATPICYLLL